MKECRPDRYTGYQKRLLEAGRFPDRTKAWVLGAQSFPTSDAKDRLRAVAERAGGLTKEEEVQLDTVRLIAKPAKPDKDFQPAPDKEESRRQCLAAYGLEEQDCHELALWCRSVQSARRRKLGALQDEFIALLEEEDGGE